MIDVKEAVRLASVQLSDLLGQEHISNVQLEEVEKTDSDSSYWLITLSYVITDPIYLAMNQNPLLPNWKQQRQYKIFKIKADSGEFVAMKMREVA